MTHGQMIEVIRAHKDGKVIEAAPLGTQNWRIAEYPSWNFEYCDYRIKPEPRVRPWQSLDEIPVGSLVVSKGGYVKSMILRADRRDNIGCGKPPDFSILVGDKRRSTREMLATYVMLDGSPCGVLDDVDR